MHSELETPNRSISSITDNSAMSENAPLLPSSADSPPLAGQQRKRPARTILVVLALIGACIFVGIKGENGLLPKNPMKRAQYFLANSPVIDGHVDLPELARVMYGNNVDKFDLRKKTVSCFHFPEISIIPLSHHRSETLILRYRSVT